MHRHQACIKQVFDRFARLLMRAAAAIGPERNAVPEIVANSEVSRVCVHQRLIGNRGLRNESKTVFQSYS